MSHSVARIISLVCGWGYFIAWSASFYPQPWMNIRRRTTEGFIIDFPLLNVIGFTCYTTSTAAFLFSPTIRQEYAARHPAAPEPTVRVNDFAFGLHASIVCVITFSQFWSRLWGWRPLARRPRPTTVTLAVLCCAAVVVLSSVGLVLVDGHRSVERRQGWGWIDVMYSLTTVKLLLTIFKYAPQAWSNYQRKSTLGWATGGIVLDVIGGVLSLVQLVIDAASQADWSGLTGNPVKLGLANISLFFDAIFLTQRFVLYGPVEPKVKDSDDDNAREPNEEDRLLGDERRAALPSGEERNVDR